MKIKRITLSVFVAGVVLAQTLGYSFAQERDELKEEFHQTYPISASGRLSLNNINGSVHVSTWNRNEVKVDAIKHAKTQERLDEAKIEVNAGTDVVRIKTRYPEYDQRDYRDRNNNNPASVEYTLTVPAGIRLDPIDLINGSL